MILEVDNGITYIKESIDENGYILHNIKGELGHDFNRGLDKITKLLLTRISRDYSIQNEYRIFLGGIHLTRLEKFGNGYKFPISNDAIEHIIVPRRVQNRYKKFIYSLKGIESLKDKLIFK